MGGLRSANGAGGHLKIESNIFHRLQWIRSAETVDSLEDGPAPLLEGSRSERAIGRSRWDGEEVVRRASRCESSSTLSTVYYGLNC